MTSREGINRTRLRQPAPLADQIYTRLGRVSSSIPSIPTPTPLNPISSTTVPTTVVQNSGNVRIRRGVNANAINLETDSNALIDVVICESGTSASALTSIITFDPEEFRSEIKAHAHNEKRLEQLVLNAINYFLTTSKRSPQQLADYTVLTLLAWAVSIHSEIFRLPAILRAMCSLLKGSTLTKTMRPFPPVNNGNNLGLTTTPYTLVCHILWLAYKDQTHWPEEFIEAYVEDTLGEQNWIKNAECHLFTSNIQTAFQTRPSTWKIDRSKILPTLPMSSATTAHILSNITDETSNDSNTNTSIPNDSLSLSLAESEASLPIIEERVATNHTDHQLILPRYDGRSLSVQNLLRTLLDSNAKGKSSSGNPTNLASSNPSPATSTSGSQPHETDKLLGLLEKICGLPEIRLYIIPKLEVWLQNSKLNRTAELLMMTLCENLTKRPIANGHHSSVTNGYTVNAADTSYIDERAIEQLVNIRFRVRVSNIINKMYVLCIREMLKSDVNLVDIIVRYLVHNEVQQLSTSVNLLSSKNPNNIPLLHASFQVQPDPTSQSLAHAIQHVLLQSNSISAAPSKDSDSLLKAIRPFLRELMRSAKTEFDSMQFCMHLIDMQYSNSLQEQFWTMIEQPEPSANEITSQRLLLRLLDCDMITRERFLYAICDLIPMIILASAQAFNAIGASGTARSTNADHWLLFIQRISFIQCSACLFFLCTLSRLFDATSTINPITYVTCLYSVLFTAQVNSYLRIENWPPEEPIGLRNDLFRLSSEIPLIGETLYLLIEIGLTPQFRMNPSIIIDLIDLNVRRTLSVEQKMSNDYISTYLRVPDNQCERFLRRFFDLTRYHIPIQIQFPASYHIPKNLSITDMFWKTCLICLLLASHDPYSFGQYVWSSVPQIRLFMEMLLTGDYTYPPKSMIETKNYLEKFYLTERVQLREEKDLILEMEKYLASPKLIDENNSQLLGKIIVLDLQQIKRPASQEKNEKNFYNLIQGFNNLYKLSSMLCRCRTPDFILEILNRKEQQGKHLVDTQTSWLTSLIDSNIDCLNVFPILCLCDYFQHIIMISHQKNIANIPSKRTVHALRMIFTRFKSIVQTVKQQSSAISTESAPIDDMICILNYFFHCLNSNISSTRSNAWLCLYNILNDSSQSTDVEDLLSRSEPISEPNIELILSTISQFNSLDRTQLLIKQTLCDTCQFETNSFLLHYSLVFIIDHCHVESAEDHLLLSNLARALVRRHTQLHLLVQHDKENKHSQMLTKFFHLISRILLKKLQHALEHPISLSTDRSHDDQLSSSTRTYLVLPNFNQEQVRTVKQLQAELKIDSDFVWSANTSKHYVEIDSILIEFLLIFLAYSDANHASLSTIANLLQQFLLSAHCAPCFTTIRQFNPPVPIKQSQDETSIPSEDDRHSQLRQFSVEYVDPPKNNRKRRLSPSTSNEKVFLAASTKPTYCQTPVNNELEQSIFQSDDLQYFIFKSKNLALVKQSIDQASFLTCIKMLKISVVSHDNMNYLCQRLNQLIDASSKQVHTYLKQSSLILPLINRWIIEQLPGAIQLGEKLRKLLEKKRKSHSVSHEINATEGKLPLIPTTSRTSTSIFDQIHSFNERINGQCDSKSADEKQQQQQEHRMDTSETSLVLPWKDPAECDEVLKRLTDKKHDPLKRRQLLLELQWLTNTSDVYCGQLFQAVLQRCRSTDAKKFVHNLNEQSNTSLVLLGILMKKDVSTDDHSRLIDMLKFYETQGKSIFGMKIKDLKRIFDEAKQATPSTGTSQRSLADDPSAAVTMNDMRHLLRDHYPLRDCRIEINFRKYLASHRLQEEECQRVLMNVLVEAEDQLSESTIGMILDQLETMDYKSSRASTNSIYASRLLFSQRSRSSISQRLLLKQFLHSCDWSTILECIHDLFTLSPPSSKSSSAARSSATSTDGSHQHRLVATHALSQSRCTMLDNRDSILILDMLEAFIKLSPLWSGREWKMLDRCHDELLVDFRSEHIYTLIIYILDEGYRRHLAKDNLCAQYQKRYESILYYLIKDSAKRLLVQECLQKLLIDYQVIPWMKDVLSSFYFILYVNQSNLFDENFYLILPNLFNDIKQEHVINTNYDYIVHDLLIRLNSYDLLSMENFFEVNLLLKQYVSKDPYLFLRHLHIIQLSLQSRLSTLTQDEFHRRHSKQRTFFISLFDLIIRLKPYIYDSIYEKNLQAILDIYIRLVLTHLPALGACSKQGLANSYSLQDLIELIDGLLNLIYHYFSSTIHNHQHNSLLKIYHEKFLDKIHEKIQMNKDLHQVLVANKYNQILYHLTQLRILYEAVKIDDVQDSTGLPSNEPMRFDVRLCLVDRSQKQLSDVSNRHKLFDIQHYRQKLSISVDEYTSPAIIDDILFTLNELKSHIDYYLTIDHMEFFLDSLTNYLLTGHKQLMQKTYDFLLRFLEKFPQHSFVFYSTYVKCLLSAHVPVFQMAIDHFSHFIIYFRSKTTDLFSLVIKQGLMNKIDVTLSITQGIRLLNLHRYDPITHANGLSTAPSTIGTMPSTTMPTTATTTD